MAGPFNGEGRTLGKARAAREQEQRRKALAALTAAKITDDAACIIGMLGDCHDYLRDDENASDATFGMLMEIDSVLSAPAPGLIRELAHVTFHMVQDLNHALWHVKVKDDKTEDETPEAEAEAA